MKRPYRRVDLSADSWTARAVVVADRFSLRLLGVRRDGVDALLLRARSIHTFGLRSPIDVATLDARGTVVSCRRMRPNRIVIERRVRWFLELPIGQPMPPEGMEIVASSHHGGNTHPLRHAHRQPR